MVICNLDEINASTDEFYYKAYKYIVDQENKSFDYSINQTKKVIIDLKKEGNFSW